MGGRLVFRLGGGGRKTRGHGNVEIKNDVIKKRNTSNN